MPTTDELVQWAMNHATVLEKDLKLAPGATYGNSWDSSDEARPKVRARATPHSISLTDSPGATLNGLSGVMKFSTKTAVPWRRVLGG